MDSRPPYRLGRTRLVAVDAVAALGYLMLLLPSAGGPAAGPVPAWARYALAAAVVLPVAVRRIWPVPVFCTVLVLSVAATLLQAGVGTFVAAAYALYPVALDRARSVRVPRAVTVTAGVIAVAAVGLGFGGSARAPSAPVFGPGTTPATFVFGGALLAGVWTVGRAVRERREYAAHAAERAVVEERLRIARELHDVVAHGMSLIAVKAGVANHVLRERPEEAHDALRLIETTSRGALTELRHMLGVLRSDGTPPADLVPTPGLARLPELVDRAALAGVRVDTDVRGADGLPEGLGLAVFRIVQEALTNVVKHAAPAHCRVAVTVADGVVEIEVTDDGPGVRVLPDAPTGHGLIGMRERTAVYGGTFAAGPRAHGGFRVHATLPVRG